LTHLRDLFQFLLAMRASCLVQSERLIRREEKLLLKSSQKSSVTSSLAGTKSGTLSSSRGISKTSTAAASVTTSKSGSLVGSRPRTRRNSKSGMKSIQVNSGSSAVISEILDTRTRNLLIDTHISDYVLSNELVAMSLAMVAENQAVNTVLCEFFSSWGNDIFLRPAHEYVWSKETTSFMDIVIRGRKNMELVIGYKRTHDTHPVLNPPNKMDIIEWDPNDTLFILGQKS